MEVALAGIHVKLLALCSHLYKKVPPRGSEPDNDEGAFPAHIGCEAVMVLFEGVSQPVFATKIFAEGALVSVVLPKTVALACSPAV